MVWSCDLVSAWEDGGIGGIVAIVLGAAGLWLKDWITGKHETPKKG